MRFVGHQTKREVEVELSELSQNALAASRNDSRTTLHNCEMFSHIRGSAHYLHSLGSTG